MKKPKRLYFVDVCNASITARKIPRHVSIEPMADEPGRFWVGEGFHKTTGFNSFSQAKAWLVAWWQRHLASKKLLYRQVLSLKRARK